LWLTVIIGVQYSGNKSKQKTGSKKGFAAAPLL
jgi:hypothetical protein